MRHTLERCAVDPIPEQRELARFIGPPLRGTLATLLGAGAGPSEVERALAVFRERFTAVGLYENVLYPGVEGALAAQAARGRRLWVVTSKLRSFAERIVEHFGLARFFTSVYGAEAGGRFEDKRDLLAHVLEVEGLSARATVMVGDREHDVRAAKHSGALSVGVAWGYGSIEELEAAGADAICAEPAALAEAIDRVVAACAVDRR
jgi:phosphoglycolate phosphatase